MALYEKDGVFFFDSQLVSYISEGENEKAQSFLAEIKNLRNLKNSSGKTLLHIAARYGNAVMTKYFIDMRFKVDAKNNFGITPLALAVQYRQIDTIAVLLKANADIYDCKERECLLQTVHNLYMSRQKPVVLHERILKLFSKKVCRDFKIDRRLFVQNIFDAKCSLYLGIRILRSPRLPRYYIKCGYDVNTPEKHGNCTALHAAVEGSDFASVKVLVRHGADVNALDSCLHTPLCYYKCGSPDSDIKIAMLEYLIERGASLTISNDNTTFTALEHLLINGKLTTVSTVLKHDIDLTAAYRFGRTPLHFLAKNTTPDVMALIQGKKFDVDVRENSGMTPLMTAIERNKNLSTVEFLLDIGADINATNVKLWTPLCFAVAFTIQMDKILNSTTEIIKLLLQRGANIQHVFKSWKKKRAVGQMTIFDMVLKNHKSEISQLLLAQLVLNSVQGEPITDLVRAKIEANEILNEQFNVCKEQIEKMKAAKINESLTLFELMTGNEDSMVHHAIDFDFISKVDELNDILQGNSYYVDIIKKRVENIVKKLKSTNEVKVVDTTQSSCCIS